MNKHCIKDTVTLQNQKQYSLQFSFKEEKLIIHKIKAAIHTMYPVFQQNYTN